jgi:hypothetical protein
MAAGALLLSLPLLYNNCSGSPELVPLTSQSVSKESVKTQNVQVNFCEPPPIAQQLSVKTLIILDHSGSNAKNYKMSSDGSGAPDLSSGNVIISTQYATDPTGTLRYGLSNSTGTLLNYLSQLPANNPAKPNRYFALIDFSDNATAYPTSGNGFTSDIQSFYKYVLTDSGKPPLGTPNDSGGTSYITALNQAYNIINGDLQAAKACASLPKTTTPTASCPQPGVVIASSYVVIFMSDGSPIIKLGLGQQNGNIIQQPLSQASCPYPENLIDNLICKESTQSILGLVGSITALASDQTYVAGVNLFTIYYYVPGNIDSSGQTLLSQMASAGNGIAYSAVSGSKLNYNQFQPPQEQLQYSLSDLFVTNASGVWWSDGKFYPDSDGDGLPDFIETQQGTDPNNPSTAGNGISDLVRYRLNNGAPCLNMGANKICQDPVPNYATGTCSGITTKADPLHPGAILFHSSDPNGLNDCEKILLNDSAGVGNPDSNQDALPDFLEFKNNIPFQVNTTPAVSSPNLDGYSLYEKIKFNMPTAASAANTPNISPAQYQLTTISTVAGQSCYQLLVSGLPIATGSDKIRVDVTFEANLSNVSEQYYVGTKSFSPTTSTLIFDDWNNPTEISNQTWSSWP